MTRDDYFAETWGLARACALGITGNAVFDHDDRTQEAALAILLAHSRYDGTTKPWTHVAKRVRGAVLDAVRKSDGGRRDIEWRKRTGITRSKIPIHHMRAFYSGVGDCDD